MDKKSLDELISILEWIATFKVMLPFQLRGRISDLGLYVQQRSAGGWSRLQAGGQLRSYLDAWRKDEDEDAEWQVKSLDEGTWQRRFARVVQPTYEIARFLVDRVATFGDLDSQGAAALNKAIERYKSTGDWPSLPEIPEEVRDSLARAQATQEAQEEREWRVLQISREEEKIRADPLTDTPMLPLLYYQEERYKDMEHALMRSIRTNALKPHFFDYKQLGKLYLAALSNHVREKGIPVFGSVPSNVTPEKLGHGTQELRTLAKENLGEAYELGVKEGREQKELKEVDLALRAATELSSEAFEQFDVFKEGQNRSTVVGGGESSDGSNAEPNPA